MSVINQVLAQLERRGARPSPEQAMVRAVVPHARRNLSTPLLVSGAVVLLCVFAAWLSAQTRKPDAVPASTARNQTIVTVAAPLSGVPAAPVAAVEIAQAGMLVPASHLNSGTSTAPLPALHETTNSVARSKVKGTVPGRPCSGPCRKDEYSAVNSSLAAPREEAPVQPLKKPDQQQPIQIASTNTQAPVQASNGVLPMKHVSSAQQADAEFHKAVALMHQGRIAGALEGYEAALRLDAGHDAARLALAALLLESKRGADAERVLQEGLKNKPEHTGFAMLLARLQVERGAVEQAAATLEKSVSHADAQADYHAFLAALLQRQNRHKEAINHYQIALQLIPDKGAWLMGYGISLQAVQRNEDAKGAYRRALDSRTLSSELQAFVQQRLRSL